MADSKITALTALTAADPANDMMPIVDVSDTSMAASGTTKRISINNILACSPTATLASATITGDLTVRTNKLAVTSTGVGIVQATPLYPLHLVGEFGLEEASAGNGSKLRMIGQSTKYNFRLGKQIAVDNAFEITPSTAVGGTTFTNPVYTVTYDGIHTFLDGAGGTRMTLNSTGLGIGASPVAKLHVSNGSTVDSGLFTGLMIGGSTASARSASIIKDTSTPYNLIIRTQDFTGGTTGSFIVRNGSTDQFQIDSSGNVGVGVSTFGTSAAKVLAIGTGTEPTTGPAGTVQLFTSTRSASNTIPAIFTEGSGVTNAAITNTTVTNKIAIKVNGTIYYLLATTSAA
jgi:hypothetical protein